MTIKERLFALLRIHSDAAGLEVSDEVLRLAVFDDKTWKMYAVRLEPGVLQQGKIKDRAAFVAAIVELKKQMGSRHAKKQLGVVACLSSVDVYTQVFRLPMVKGKGLDEAVTLNLQMASPIPVADAYSAWQVVGHNENTVQVEILAAFVARKVVDEMADALFDGGFLAMAVESRGLALTRLVREKGAGVDVPKAYLFANIDSFGLDFLIIRNGALYFEYENPWHDLMDAKGEITAEKFETTLAVSLRQVLNFYTQSWPEPLGAIILSTVVFQAEAERIITENTTFPAVRLTLVMGQPISSEWLVVLGSSLRVSASHGRDREINLLGKESRDRFHEERLLRFIAFWRTVIPVTLTILLATFVTADFFLGTMLTQAGTTTATTVDAAQLATITTLENSAKTFNNKVTLLSSVEATLRAKNALIEKLASVSGSTGVTVTHISFQGITAPVSITGYATAQDHILAFQTDLGNDAAFSNINLPLTGVQTQGDSVSFSMTFTFTPPSQ